MTPLDPPSPRCVFVYGTLIPGERNAWVAEAAGAPERRERATLHGYALHDLRPEGYPALTSGTQTVQGWLLHYDAETWPSALSHLDDLEGLHLVPPLYIRTLADAVTDSGPQQVWVYLYARAARLAQPGCELVVSGDWTTRTDRMTDSVWPGEEEASNLT